jgi:hypothetical protein
MALIDDLQVSLPQRRLNINATAGTFYTPQALYSLLQNLFDELGAIALAGAMAYPVPMSAQTPTDFTLINGWYLTDNSYLRLRGGSIQTNGYDSEIYRLTLASAGYTNAVSGDIGKTVQNSGATATGTLLYFDNTSRTWLVRKGTGTFTNSEALTIATGTGAGTTASSNGVLTGEDKWNNWFVLGTVNHHQGTYWEQAGVAVDPVTAGYYATAPTTAADLLVQIQRAGSLIASGFITVYNRVNRDAANAIDSSTTGDTYDFFRVDLNAGGRSPVPLNTAPDLDDTLTNTQAAALSIALATSGPYTADINQDGTTESYEGQVNQNSVTNAQLWSAIKWFFRKGATDLVNGIQAQLFTTLNSAYAITKASPVATIAGGTIFYARGWVPTNVASADASRYQVITSAGVITNPPVFYLRAVSGLVSGLKVFLARGTTAGALLNEFTLGAGNSSGNSTLVLSAAIPSDKPPTGFVRVFDNSGNEDRYAYSSFSGSTLTVSGTLTKTYATGNNAYIPYLDTTSSGTSVSAALRYVADRAVVLFVRSGSSPKIIPFASAFTLGANDSNIPATVLTDTINNN